MNSPFARPRSAGPGSQLSSISSSHGPAGVNCKGELGTLKEFADRMAREAMETMSQVPAEMTIKAVERK